MGLAAGAGAALARYSGWATTPLSAAAVQLAERRALGFPVAADEWHGDSSVGAAIRSGVIPHDSPLETVVRSLQWPDASRVPGDDNGPRDVESGSPAPGIHAGERLRSRFRDLRRHFVFEYYPWYQTDPYDHWNEGGHRPPFDIASPMVPALGAYDSGDAQVIAQHARWIAESGVGAIALSWWGQNSYCDRAVPLIMDVMRAHDIKVTFHLEPYRDDRVRFYAEDIRYILREYGERRRWDAFLLLEHADGTAIPVFKSFRTILPATFVDCKGRIRRVPDFATTGEWRQQTDAIREQVRPTFDRIVLLADSLDLGSTIAGGFDGIAIYDSFVRPSVWRSAALASGTNRLLFSFPINCGFDRYVSIVPTGDCDLPTPFEPPVGPIDWTFSDSRRTAYLASLNRVLESTKTTIDVQVGPVSFNDARGFFLTYVNTFNEWHEGTAFEPARNLTDLLPEERGFNYHNPPDGAWRLRLLQSLLRAVITDGFA
jgi:Glycosyl hydrolase family 99